MADITDIGKYFKKSDPFNHPGEILCSILCRTIMFEEEGGSEPRPITQIGNEKAAVCLEVHDKLWAIGKGVHGISSFKWRDEPFSIQVTVDLYSFLDEPEIKGIVSITKRSCRLKLNNGRLCTITFAIAKGYF